MRASLVGLNASLVWVTAMALSPGPGFCSIPDVTMSYYVPQAGPVALPVEGNNAIKFLKTCPNNDGGTALPSNVRIKIVVRDVNGNGIVGIDPSAICVLLNGGTAAQGFSGIGADSVIANSAYNSAPMCPDVRCILADSATNAQGFTYITFIGANPGSPGIGVRDSQRKWGHFDDELPVYVYGTKLSGRLTSGAANGTFTLRIKNVDLTGGLGTLANQGETVTVNDLTVFTNQCQNGSNPAMLYWCDFDWSGSIGIADQNFITNHLNHDCDTPSSP